VIASRPMPIQRSWLRTMVWTLVMLVMLGLAGFMGYSGAYLVSGVLALFGLLSVVGIGSGSYITDCPVCGNQLRGFDRAQALPKMSSYGKLSEGEYYELAAGFCEQSSAARAAPGRS